ncbi:unnamed protein product [Strongylus vulgaris]|uniref:Uncharacterized protein n=1 Tax=Strongylus vulgaris TaxID=40348 RepID=A0A3P7IXT8_STRVU|nr:unnamed protein product [Strongylus vulgaris]
MWKHGLPSVATKHAPKSSSVEAEAEKIPEKSSATPTRPAIVQELVKIRKDSSSNDSNDDVFSPVSVKSSKIPSVTEITQKEGGTEREDIETVSLKDSSRASNTPMAQSTAQEEEDRKSLLSSSRSENESLGIGRSSSSESAASVLSQGERVPPTVAASQNSDDLTPRALSKLEKDKNELRTLLGDLPPIAKPRLSKVTFKLCENENCYR